MDISNNNDDSIGARRYASWLGRGVLVAAMLHGVACREAESPPPNIVLIVADDLGWRDTGVYGSQYYQTPNIDLLAAEGMRFTRAYSSSPLCSPARASIVSGFNPAYLRFTKAEGHDGAAIEYPKEMPSSAGADREVVAAPSATRLALRHKTVGRRLQEAGYRTGFFGKWHLGTDQWLPDQRGYDVAIPGGSHWGIERYYSPYGLAGFEDGPVGEHLDQRLAKEALAFVRSKLESSGDQPFFVSYSPYSVHYPYRAKRVLIQKYQRTRDPSDPQRYPVMAAMIEELDTSLGMLFAGLKEAGVWENTVILLTSDNGGVDWLGPTPEVSIPTDNFPLRGGKAQIYEGGIRVPLIVSWPDRMAAPGISDQLVSGEDLFTTILHLAGIDRNRDPIHHGHSLFPLITGQSAETGRDSVVIHVPQYLDRLNAGPASSIHVGPWKLIHNYATQGVGGQAEAHELYNLEHDIGETNNRAADQPERVAALRRRLDAALTEMNALLPIANPAFRPENGSSISMGDAR